jgi:hypothetical protein
MRVSLMTKKLAREIWWESGLDNDALDLVQADPIAGAVVELGLAPRPVIGMSGHFFDIFAYFLAFWHTLRRIKPRHRPQLYFLKGRSLRYPSEMGDSAL